MTLRLITMASTIAFGFGACATAADTTPPKQSFSDDKAQMERDIEQLGDAASEAIDLLSTMLSSLKGELPEIEQSLKQKAPEIRRSLEDAKPHLDEIMRTLQETFSGLSLDPTYGKPEILPNGDIIIRKSPTKDQGSANGEAATNI